MTFEKRQKWSVVVEIRTIVASGGQGKGWTGKENFSEVMEIFYVLIWVLLVFICQHTLNCILKICAFDFLNYTSIKKKFFLRMDYSVRVSCFPIKWDDIYEVLKTLSVRQQSWLSCSHYLYFCYHFLFLFKLFQYVVFPCKYCFRALECIRFGDSFVKMRWRWRCWNS